MKKLIVALCLLALAGQSARAQGAHLVKEGSSVTYRLVHPLHKVEATSKEVTYKLDIDPAKKEIKRVEAEVDVTTFDSGNSNRDSHAMEVIDAISYPEAIFTSAAITQTADSLKITGSLTFHGLTREIVAAAATQWSPNRLQVAGGFDVSLTEFSIDRPSLLFMPVEDKLSFSFIAVFTLE
jgi:polyisoprenoid-binding protein YceI